MPNRQERYTTTRTSKENCTERMQPSGTINRTHVPVAAVLVLNTPDDGR